MRGHADELSAHGGHADHAGMIEEFKKRFYINRPSHKRHEGFTKVDDIYVCIGCLLLLLF